MLLPVILKSLLVTVAVLLGMGFILALVTGGIARLINRGGG